MKKLVVLSIFVLFGIESQLSASIQGMIEGKISYYYQMDSTTRGVFNNRVLYGLEGSIGDRLTHHQALFGYVGTNLYSASGHSIGQNTKTELLLIPIEIGMKYLLSVRHDVDMYIGVAATPFYVNTTDDSSFVIHKRSKWDIGGTFKGGALIFPKQEHFFIDIFLSYYLLSTKFSDTHLTIGREADLSGLSVGGGLGWEF